MTPEGALGLYYKLAGQHGRNNALFQVACLCRDAGWNQARTEQVLCAVHMRQASVAVTRQETDAQRYREAERTIASAYSRPRRARCASTNSEPISRIPNALREKLLALKLTPALRVLEGLIVSGVEPGTIVRYSDLVTCLRPLEIGDWSIRLAIKAVLPDGELLFPPTHPQVAHAAESATITSTTTAYLSQSKNQRIQQYGPASKFFRMPSIPELCARLGISSGYTKK